MKHTVRLLCPFAVALAGLPALARDLPQLPKDFVYLREVAPGIAQDMRYATADNFTGAPLPGYDAAECVLRRDAAQALAKVQADLEKDKLSLKTYDCYRPERAVRAMWRWAHDGSQRGDKSHYPAADKSELFNLGYIASRSKHSTGTAVDLTLIPLGAPAPDGNARRGPCTAPAAERAPDNSLDMGTGFDCFDPKTWTRSGAVTPEQRRTRDRLRAAMSAHGFHNYFREWWHYEYGSPQRAYDFPIEKR